MVSRAEQRMARIRYAIMGFVLLIMALLAGIGLFYTMRGPGAEFVAGTHYRVLEDARPRRAGEPIRVLEFFSYGCIHCRNFDPMLEDWKKTLPEGVVFERVPVTFSPAWTVLAQTYYALDELGALERNHQRIFRAIHDTGRQFLTVEAMADFIHGNGATRQEFLSAVNSPTVRRRIRDAELAQRDFLIGGVPTLVVAGRYVIGMEVGRRGVLEVANHLIALEQDAGAAQSAAAP
jgi:protein dithiol oxidoreductase (disulfide-forming)